MKPLNVHKRSEKHEYNIDCMDRSVYRRFDQFCQVSLPATRRAVQESLL